jgi:isocitrate dehydrogenase (NAD+)
MSGEDQVERALEHFRGIIQEQMSRVEDLDRAEDWVDYDSIRPITIGVVGGDGIGPIICDEARRVLEFQLKEEMADGKIQIKTIEGLTIENRVKVEKAIPDDVLEELRSCHVILKGPTTTPQKGDNWPNIESANVAMRRELDLFANVRPVRIPDQGIDWVFFRENTEGAYIMGSKGVAVTDDLAFDFTVATSQGSERIIELAFEHAKKHRINKVTVVTKANVIKTTDGKFLDIAREVASRYPEVEWDDWYIDIMTAKLIDPARRKQFKVVVLPNLYGDIITDEAAQIQGGVGTAGAANIGKRYAMFEAIHGSAPRMVDEGRAQYANPQSMMRAVVMLLEHIGHEEKASRLEKALDICFAFEKRVRTTGRPDGATAEEISEYVMETIQDPDLDDKWIGFQEGVAAGK